MLKTVNLPVIKEDGAIDTELWLKNFAATRPNKNHQLIKQAVILAQLAGEHEVAPTGESCLEQGLDMANILTSLNVDDDTITAAILYSSVSYADLKPEDITEHLNAKVGKLISGTKQMAGISELYKSIASHEQQKHNIDNIRKMLLAMVDDIRVVLIKMAERLCILRRANIFSKETKQQIAKETMAIYAPLANRLGITQLKLEMEDLAFSYVMPDEYKKIASFLKQNQNEREQYIKDVLVELNEVLKCAELKGFLTSGRAKHIYSIYRKMQRKNTPIEEIYDVSAIRILVGDIQDCYKALSAVHSTWQNIPKEFDDYITSPKSNGYRSIHTAVIGPQGKNVEIQIRTFDMHKMAELGVAAHWVYKEDIRQKSNYEAKITWLRQVVDWQKELTSQEDELHAIREIFNDRVYVFTPKGDILDFPNGATPLDFAYHIHSEIGHRCRGAKVENNIVPLTYHLKTGEHIEILTGKHESPSRDWLNPSLGFLKTSRAKSKVLHWFKKQDYEQNLKSGAEIIDAEFRRLNIRDIDHNDLSKKLHFKTREDFFAALGSGDIKISHIISVVQNNITLPTPKEVEIPSIHIASSRTNTSKQDKDVRIYGIGNLLSSLAQCCKPVPGDEIAGYITLGKGVSIHRKDCPNLLHSNKIRPEKILAVSWGSKTEKLYPVDLIVTAYARNGLVRDITTILANDNLTIRGLNLNIDKNEQYTTINITIDILGLTQLSRVLTKISKVQNVIEVKRQE